MTVIEFQVELYHVLVFYNETCHISSKVVGKSLRNPQYGSDECVSL